MTIEGGKGQRYSSGGLPLGPPFVVHSHGGLELPRTPVVLADHVVDGKLVSLRGEDHIDALYDTITLREEQSCQLFSGFSGTGKSTELRRLTRRLERILRERFGMTTVFHLSTHHDGRNFEVDLVGYAGNEVDEVYLAEIKHQLQKEDIEQILGHLRRFPRVFPEHRGKKLFGILAAVIVPDQVRAQALKEGLPDHRPAETLRRGR